MARQSKGRQSTGRRRRIGKRVLGPKSFLQAPNLRWESPPKQIQFPSIAALNNLPDAELSLILERFDLTSSIQQRQMNWLVQVDRISDLPPGSSDTVQRMLQASEGVATKKFQEARKAYRQYTTIDGLLGADPATAELIRISEGDENVCSSCVSKAGETGTIAYHASIGLPGAASCDGLESCRCQLSRFE